MLLGAVPWWAVLLLAAAAFGVYVLFGREHRNPLVREASWIAAVSQLVVVLVPVLAVVLTTLAVVALVIVAVGVLAPLLARSTARLDSPRAVGRSQAVRQRVLVPRSQVRILAPQPFHSRP